MGRSCPLVRSVAMVSTSKTDERDMLVSQILAMAPGIGPLTHSTVAQLRDMLTGMQAKLDRFAALGFVDESAPPP